MFFERRTSLRVRPNPREPVEVQFVSAGMLEIAHATDISETGIGVRLDARVGDELVGTKVELIISLPDQAPIYTRAEVRRVRERHLVGLKFLNPSRKLLDSIHAYTQRRMEHHSGKFRLSG